MESVLKIRRADDHRIEVLDPIEFIIVAHSLHIMAHLTGKEILCFLAPQLPQIRHCNDIIIEFIFVVHETREQRTPESVREPYHAHAYPIIRTDDARVAAGRHTHTSDEDCGSSFQGVVDELSSFHTTLFIQITIIWSPRNTLQFLPISPCSKISDAPYL